MEPIRRAMVLPVEQEWCPTDAQSLSLDEALREIKTRINQQADPGQPPPPPQV